MKAIASDGGELVWKEFDDPTLSEGEVAIQVHATAVNRADLSQRAGNYAPPPGASEILGLECAGIVDGVGKNVQSFKSGDAVCALLAGGGYAERVVVPSGQVVLIPAGLDFIQAAALPEVFATAYLNIFMEASAKPGELVLIHAGASGVGTAAIQMCRAFGNPCFVTVGSQEKVEQCLQLGATNGCNRHTDNFVDLVPQWTNAAGVDVILDPVGGRYLKHNLQCLARDGRLVIIGLMGGATAEVALGPLMIKRQRIIGSTLRARSVAGKAAVMNELRRRVWPEIEAGAISPIVESVIPVQEAEAAHQLIASNETIGKVVLQVNTSQPKDV